MRLVMLGPPASGKGTQASRIADLYRVPHLSTGALLREEVRRSTDLGRHVGATLARGELVDDDTVVPVVRRELARARSGWVLDGFPRTLAQAQALDHDRGLPPDLVVYLEVTEDVLAVRVRGRARKERRADDSAETLRRRLAVFEERTAPLLDYYKGRGLLTRVDGTLPMDEVTDAIALVVKTRLHL